jgi:hypothetical protein
MSIVDAPVQSHRGVKTESRAREIGIECDSALRLLDRLVSEQDDVLLDYARRFVRRAGALSELIVQAERGG